MAIRCGDGGGESLEEFKTNNLFTQFPLDHYCRLNGQLVVLTSALQTWTQLEVGLGEFTDGLGKYRTLYELKGVLERGEVQLPSDTVMDVRQVSRLLTERIEAYQQVSGGIIYCYREEGRLSTNSSRGG